MRFTKKSKKYTLIIVLVLVVLILYNVIDNNRIRVVEDVVSIKNLPSNFEGFTILHIHRLTWERVWEKINQNLQIK